MIRPRYVKTIRANGCAVSCLAMVTGQSFLDVLRDVKPFWENDGQFNGLNAEVCLAYLAARGVAVQIVKHENPYTRMLAAAWPPAPFAPIHIAEVHAGGDHDVVMLEDGSILDPNDRTMHRLAQYHRVFSIWGCWPVGRIP